MDVYKSGFMLLPFWVRDMAGWCGVVVPRSWNSKKTCRHTGNRINSNQPIPAQHKGRREEQESKWDIRRTAIRKKLYCMIKDIFANNQTKPLRLISLYILSSWNYNGLIKYFVSSLIFFCNFAAGYFFLSPSSWPSLSSSSSAFHTEI